MRRLIAAALFLGLALAWQVAETPRVKVLFAPGQEALAEAVLARAEAALSTLSPFLGEPKKTPVLRLDPGTDFYNGYASVFPRPGTTLFPAFPYYEGAFWNTADPLYTLVLHELVHLLHLAGPENGLGLLPNGVARPYPAWLVEGLATYFESQGGGGRLHDGYTRGLLRALAEDPPSLAEASTAFFPRFPFGELRYRVGVAFVDFLIQQHGWEALRRAFERYQRVPMPFSLYLSDAFAEAWKEAAGTELKAEWRAFWESQRVKARPPAPTGPAGCSPAAFGGRLAYVHEDAIVVGEKRFPHPLGRTVGRLAWLDERTLVFDRLEPTGAGGYVRRLFALDVVSGRETPIPGALHAYHPTAHRGTIYYVEEGKAGSRLVELKDGKKRVRYQAPKDRHLVGVAASDRGLAVLVWEAGRVYPLLLEDSGPRRLAAHGRVLKDLAWWQGRLVFASDASGVYQIYALDPETGALALLVAHPYGAFAPAGAEDGLYYVALTRKGFFVEQASPTPKPIEPIAAAPLPRPKLPEVKPQRHPYRPLASLAPAGWLPLFPFGALALGVDAANELDWLLAANTDLRSGFLLLSAGYTPRFGLAPERYRLTLSNQGAALAYSRRFLAGRARGSFEAALGAALGQPALEVALLLEDTRARGRDRVWGEASEGRSLSVLAGHGGAPYGLLALAERTPEGWEASFALGRDVTTPWLGPGTRAALRLGHRSTWVLDHYEKDGLFYLSHLTLEPEVGLAFSPEEGIAPGASLTLRAHLAYRYYLPLTPELRLGYRADRGFWVGLGF